VRGRTVVVVPSTPALLPAYAGLEDPVPDLRSACLAAVSWLVSTRPEAVGVVSAPARQDNVARGADVPAGLRIARHLVTTTGYRGALVEPDTPGLTALLVVANGSATRGERAPGHHDERALSFDASIERALRSGDPTTLRQLDPALGGELWAHDVEAFRTLGALVPRADSVSVDYAGDPYEVQYWVVRWTCGS